ncbi:hypothetical protein RRG08_065360 [Elysia crispata]|uniref:Uncharacterized protein n=1 Tax=Elysia crispata TaxID=231223 RepID=A0AAE1AGE8_9GAST|nr:hypothetical protein RRG08_065360 [Elysia crispata]
MVVVKPAEELQAWSTVVEEKQTDQWATRNFTSSCEIKIKRISSDFFKRDLFGVETKTDRMKPLLLCCVLYICTDLIRGVALGEECQGRTVRCFSDPCAFDFCPAIPDAVCSMSPCTCAAKFTSNGADVTQQCRDSQSQTTKKSDYRMTKLSGRREGWNKTSQLPDLVLDSASTATTVSQR